LQSAWLIPLLLLLLLVEVVLVVLVVVVVLVVAAVVTPLVLANAWLTMAISCLGHTEYGPRGSCSSSALRKN
jgi:hypothetical protein